MRQSAPVTDHADGDAYLPPRLSRIEYELLDSEDLPAAPSPVDQVSMAVLTVDVTSGWPEFAGDTLLHYRFSLGEGANGRPRRHRHARGGRELPANPCVGPCLGNRQNGTNPLACVHTGPL